MMTITYSFTPNTIRIHCGGDTLEVPLPSPAPSSITSSRNIDDGIQLGSSPPRPPTIGRPRVTPTVIGIFTTNDINIEEFTYLLNNDGSDTPNAIISFNEIEITSPDKLAQRFDDSRDNMSYGENNCFILDVGIEQNNLPTEAQLSALENILRNPQYQLQGIRLVKIPDV